jgi:hypothetical protein
MSSSALPKAFPYFRVHAAPFDPGPREVIILCERHVAMTTRRLLIRVRDEHDAVVGEMRLR